MASLTGASCIYTLSITGLYDAPQQLQGFSADNIFETETIDVAETLMGVDGILSGGRVNVPIPQSIDLQGDSPSNFIFDQWVSAQKRINDIYYANAIILLPALGSKYTMTRGILTKYPPISGVKKLIQPRRFTIVWQDAEPSPN